ncbi:UAA transporter [Cryphonectria parasitica EP155]|uniref:UDP-galactose transporter homolog 1 n=1 Tax=Cryphonectria parasitica (strain ATCC 38755 / EP155) TaxID=660469 RepID=A0A9P5CTW2_CRYP1|nr:UAA transporter [Cryphonectria parasitica EP155]KAF3769851.1 UAA transporter [Cryphonectria parasitica EP155]
MARTKAAAPIRRELSSEYTGKHDRTANGRDLAPKGANGSVQAAKRESTTQDSGAGVIQLLICVLGIYGSFLTWGVLQEKVLTTPYTNPSTGLTEKWKFPVFLQVIQSIFSSITGSLYLYTSTPKGQAVPAIIPNQRIILPLLLVAVCQALAAPIGYAALAHVNYITYTLAKSCKLLPVMFLHITLFRKKYPLYKYLVVAAVTIGVAVFTLHSGKKKSSHSSSSSESGQTAWGMFLLGINLLFDGLTNSTQDWIVSEFRPYRGPQMMCANNMMSSALSGLYLVLSPWLVSTPVGAWFGMAEAVGGDEAGELYAALGFMARHPGVWWDVLGFAACGAVGQVFIFYTIANFGSVILVTVTVTRKMLTMILSVIWYGHSLTHMQWLGVSMVFGGIGVEAKIKHQSEMQKAEHKKKQNDETEKKAQ